MDRTVSIVVLACASLIATIGAVAQRAPYSPCLPAREAHTARPAGGAVAVEDARRPMPAKTIEYGNLTGLAVTFPEPAYTDEQKRCAKVMEFRVDVIANERGDVVTADVKTDLVGFIPTIREAAMKAQVVPIKVRGTPVGLKGFLLYKLDATGASVSRPKLPVDLEAPLPSMKMPERPSTVARGVLNGKAISFPMPSYPEAGRAAKAQGTVNVNVLVDESGSVVSATAVSGHPLLRDSAVTAARQAKFEPLMIGHTPVKMSGVLVYNFVP